MNYDNLKQNYDKYHSEALLKYYDKTLFIEKYNNVPKFRDYTFTKCLNFLLEKNKNKHLNILELGTSRSYLDGKYEGCMVNDIKYWESNNPEKWDWSAGLFSKYFTDLLDLKNKEYTIDTIDIDSKAINISKNITNNHKNINYNIISSEDFLNNTNKKYDLIYIDTGSMDQYTINLHLREAKIIVSQNILLDDGLILIDDIKNPHPAIVDLSIYGKGKDSIPYFLENKYEIIDDEYQYILKKKI